MTELVVATPPDVVAAKAVTLTVRGAGGTVPLSQVKVDLFSARP